VAAAVAELRVVTSGVSSRRLRSPLTHLSTTSQELGRVRGDVDSAHAEALNEMNLDLHHVLSDISGQSGLRILDAILAGERDPRKPASLLADRRVEKSQAQIEAALTGDYRPATSLFSRQEFRRTGQDSAAKAKRFNFWSDGARSQNSLRPPSSYNLTPGEDYIAGPVITMIHPRMLVTVDTSDSPVKLMTVF
jgi:hypothetical protein